MTFDHITAPYGFVPLSQTIHFPAWIQPRPNEKGLKIPPPLHDVPFEDGLCGSIELELTTETPLFTRGAEKDPSLPFKLPDGRYAIPGTALRGALRNLVEIVTFSRFSRVNNHRYTVRDLQNRNLYGQFMAEIVKDPKTGKGEPMPLINSGWLCREQDAHGRWTYWIEVSDFAKIEYRPLQEIASQRGVKAFNPGEKQSSVDKYTRWGAASLDVEISAIWRRPSLVGQRRMVSEYGLAALQPASRKGVLVFTGQPARWTPDPTGKRPGAGNAKHHDFVFFSRGDSRRIDVSRKAFKDFVFAHSDRGEQNSLGRSQTPNKEWGYWKERMERGARVPVFFLTDDAGLKLKAMGLAMMFRLSYKHSIGEAVSHVDVRHGSDDAGLDFSDGIFGTVRTSGPQDYDDDDDLPVTRARESALALKGRIGISHAICQESPQPQEKVQVILGSPKASYYPNYVEQDACRQVKQLYRTWMDNNSAPRGWKRYHVLSETWTPEVPTAADGRPVDLARIGTSFRPLPQGTRFRAHVDVHNLKPEELGALLWVVDFGGDAEARHSVGMARPLGYGRVRMAVASSDIRTMQEQPADLAECRRKFEAYMENNIPGWRSSLQVQELLAISHPVPPAQARYQRLDPGRRINEFVDAKRAGFSLPPVSTQRSPSAASNVPGVSTSGVPTSNTGGAGTRVPSPSRWPGKQPYDILEVELTGLNKKEKWRCTVVGYSGTLGTIVGTAPKGTAIGQRHRVIVIDGNDPVGLQLKWG